MIIIGELINASRKTIGAAIQAGDAAAIQKVARAQAEAVVSEPGRMRSTMRHARIPADRAEEFFSRVVELAQDFTALPRDGDVVFGFVAAVYPTDHPVLPEPS